MAQIDKHDFPISLAKDIHYLISKFKQLRFDHIELVETEHNLIFFRFKDKETFYFRVFNPGQFNDLSSYFQVELLPSEENTLYRGGGKRTKEEALEEFERWLNFLDQYKTLTFSDPEDFSKIYEEEFYNFFELIDEDADTHPFEYEKQIFLLELLSKIETDLKKTPDEEIKEIIESVQSLKNSIQELTKNQATRRLSEIFGKIQKKGTKLLHDIIDVGKKEIIKKALYSGYDGITNLIDLIQQ
jgi:hypothetical protein